MNMFHGYSYFFRFKIEFLDGKRNFKNLVTFFAIIKISLLKSSIKLEANFTNLRDW